MSQLPPCPKCSSEYTYEDGVQLVCPECGHEWTEAEQAAAEAGKVAANDAPASVQSAYSTMRWIVTIGWAIYPLGYFFGYMAGGADMASLNIIYNLADVLNKIAFGVIIWNVAVAESEAK